MESLPRLNLLVIRSSRMEQAVRFYETLGFEFQEHSHGSGPVHFACVASGMVFEIYPSLNGKTTESVRMGFLVDDLDATIANLRNVGDELLSSPRETEWGRQALVRDLDGHKIELLE